MSTVESHASITPVTANADVKTAARFSAISMNVGCDFAGALQNADQESERGRIPDICSPLRWGVSNLD